MSARRVQGDFMLTQGYTVATGQAVEAMDMVAYPFSGAAYSASIAYVPGQVVTSASINYICIQAGTGQTPASSPTYWAVLTNNSIVRASDLSAAWSTAITDTVIVLTDGGTSLGAGAPFTNGSTGFKISYNFPWGEGTLSAAVNVTPTAHAGVYITGLAPQWPAVSTNLYIETAAGSGVYKLANVHVNDAAFVTTYGAGRLPPTAVAQTATALSQYVFAQNFVGVSNQRMPTSGPPAIYGTPTRPFGNSADNTIMVCRGGVFEFDCVSATFVEGQFVGAAKASGNALLNQTVVAVDYAALAIGRVFKRATSATKVMVEIASRYQPAIIGPSPNALEY